MGSNYRNLCRSWKKIATDIDSAENARQEAEILVQKRQDELAAARTEATQIIDEAKKTGKTKELKIIAEAYDEAKRLKEKANQDIAQSLGGSTCWR